MASDRIVTARDVLQALMELRRCGHQDMLTQLEQIEPDLLEYLLEQLSSIHRLLYDGTLKPRIVRRLTKMTEQLALSLVLSLRAAHARLWAVDDQATPRDEAACETTLRGGDGS